MREYSRTLGKLNGDAQEQIDQIISQIRRMQEETEDMFRELENQMQRIAERLDQMMEVG